MADRRQAPKPASALLLAVVAAALAAPSWHASGSAPGGAGALARLEDDGPRVDGPMDGDARPFDVAHASLVAAAGDGDAFTRAIAMARIATGHQASIAGPLRVGPAGADASSSPSDALTRLSAQLGTHVPARLAAELAALDTLPPAVAAAFTAFVDAFRAEALATRVAFDGLDPVALATAKTAGAPDDEVRRLVIALGPVFPARLRLLDAAAALRDALEDPALVAAVPPFKVQLAPVFSVTFNTTAPDAYTDGYALLFDAGGHDTYLNNAGGSNVLGIPCLGAGAAVLVDLAGHDRYGDATAPVCGGANGGGSLGTGLLIDGGGDDAYVAGDRGVNGGGSLGAGMLVDAGGDDLYKARSEGTNGGGSAGFGALIDVDGADRYRACDVCLSIITEPSGNLGTNGGGEFLGGGLLFDGGGGDLYFAGRGGTNGGAFSNGGSVTGLLVDAGGGDQYSAVSTGVNGGAVALSGFQSATSLLLDCAGLDFYYEQGSGAGTDLTVVPKGRLGAQLDVGPLAPGPFPWCS